LCSASFASVIPLMHCTICGKESLMFACVSPLSSITCSFV
jgi:hypothetical protein